MFAGFEFYARFQRLLKLYELMKMDVVAGSGNDEFYTPEYAIQPILKYLPREARVWCPFDTPESNYVKLISSAGRVVFQSHISMGEDGDFFKKTPPKNTTHIISNPPYSMKGPVLQRLFDLKIPFAMLVGVVGLFESKTRFEMFSKNKFEIMYFNKRISYLKNYQDAKPALNPPFSSVYVCQGMLPQQIIFETLQK